MSRPALKVAEIFRAYGPAWRQAQAGHVSLGELKVMWPSNSAARRWLEARQAELLPVEYYHLVLTLPVPVGALAWYNKSVLYHLLFQAAAETLLTLGADPCMCRSKSAVICRGSVVRADCH